MMMKARMVCIVGVALATGCKGKTDEAKQGPATSAPAATGAQQPAKPTESATAPAAAAAVVADACGVFTPEDISAGGVKVAKSTSTWPESKTADGLPLVQCGWDEGTGGPGEYSVHLDVHNFKSIERSTQYLNDMRVTVGNMSFENLPNIADEAIATRMKTAKQVQTGIAWRKGTTVYKLGIVRLDGLDLAAAEAMLVKIADAKF